MDKNITDENIPKSCQNASHFSDKLQYEEASFWEKLKLKMHIAYCNRCRKYNTKNALMTKLFNNNTYKTLDLNDLKDIKEKVTTHK